MDSRTNPPPDTEPLLILMAPLFAVVKIVTAPDELSPAAPMLMLLLLERTKELDEVELTLARAPVLLRLMLPVAPADRLLLTAVVRAPTLPPVALSVRFLAVTAPVPLILPAVDVIVVRSVPEPTDPFSVTELPVT